MTEEEFRQRYDENHALSSDGSKVSLPCVFCGAAGFAQVPVALIREAPKTKATCDECGRSARRVDGEVVQVGGDDPPPWVKYKREE